MTVLIGESMLDMVGHTPLAKLNRVVPPAAADVFVKLEWFNPTGSTEAAASALQRMPKVSISRIGVSAVRPAVSAERLELVGLLAAELCDTPMV